MHNELSRHSTHGQFSNALVTVVALSTLAFLALAQGGCSKAAHATGQEAKAAYPATLTEGAPCGSCVAPAVLSWQTVIPPPGEPGEPLEISGTIYQADGVTPAAGVVIFVYHTDVGGYYNKEDDPGHPRLRGWMKTGADGRYAFHSIKPGAYPHRKTPAHIHAHLYARDYSERSIDDYWFEGDPRITTEAVSLAKQQGSTPVIVTLKRDGAGVFQGKRDITIKPKAK